MTQAKYKKHMMTEHDDNYFGKHEKKYYRVWRVLSPSGPEEIIYVYSLNDVKKEIEGCWDWEVTDEFGRNIPDKCIIYQ